jgi:hypothetical protein
VGGGWKGTPRRGVMLDYNLKVCFGIYSSSSRVETVMYSSAQLQLGHCFKLGVIYPRNCELSFLLHLCITRSNCPESMPYLMKVMSGVIDLCNKIPYVGCYNLLPVMHL